MILGSVSATYEAVVRLTVRGSQGQECEVETVIDTGFDGSLSLPPHLVETLGLPWRRRGRAILADGTESIFDIYEATVLWDGDFRRVTVDAAECAPLIGMTLLRGYKLTISVERGGNVLLEPL